MDNYSDSNERPASSLALFAFGFIGFIIGASGVVLASVPLAIVGLLIFLVSVLAFTGSRD